MASSGRTSVATAAGNCNVEGKQMEEVCGHLTVLVCS